MILSLILISCIFAEISLADDISLVSGLFKDETAQSKLRTKETSVGARYASNVDKETQWFVQAALSLKSYSGIDNSPDGTTSMSLGGGMNFFFQRLAPRITPLLSFYGEYRDLKSADASSKTTTTGLFYGGELGLRFKMSRYIFFEILGPIFESALNAKTETENPGKAESERTEIFVSSTGPFNSAKVSLGYIF